MEIDFQQTFLFLSNVPGQMLAGLFHNDSLLMTNLQLNWNPGPASVTECHNSVVCSWTAHSGTGRDQTLEQKR